MNTTCIFYVIKFLLLLKFGRATLFDVVTRNHGSQCRKQVLRCIDLHKKLSKCELDVDFLNTCKTYDIFPKFLRFKLYKRSLHTSEAYKSFQYELLDQELSSRTERAVYLRQQHIKLRDNLQRQLSFFEFRMFKLQDLEILQAFTSKCKKTHQKKLHHLGIYNELSPC